MIFHFRAGIAAVLPAFALLDPLARSGYLGVNLFFVLSGFILTYNYASSLGHSG